MKFPDLLHAAQWALVAAFLLFPVVFALGNVAIGTAFALSLCAKDFRVRWQLVREVPVAWWALGLYAWVVVGVAYSPAPVRDIVLHLNKYAKLLLIPALMPLLAQDLWRRRCLNAFVVGMTFILASVYANVFWQLPWSVTQNLGWGNDHTVVGDYITQNVMMAFFFVLAIAKGQASTGLRRGVWWAGAVLAMFAIAQLSKGRTGYLLLFVGAIGYVFFALRGWQRWVALGGVLFAVAAVLLASQTVHARIMLGLSEIATSGSMEINSIGGRVNFWRHSWELIQKKPLAGWGTGSYHATWCLYVTQPGWCEFGSWHPHNQYLFFWLENGIFGLILFLLLVGATAQASRKACPHDRPLLWSFSLIFAVNSLINSPLFSGRESHFFIMLLLWLSAQAYFGSGNRSNAVSA